MISSSSLARSSCLGAWRAKAPQIRMRSILLRLFFPEKIPLKTREGDTNHVKECAFSHVLSSSCGPPQGLNNQIGRIPVILKLIHSCLYECTQPELWWGQEASVNQYPANPSFSEVGYTSLKLLWGQMQAHLGFPGQHQCQPKWCSLTKQLAILQGQSSELRRVGRTVWNRDFH